MRRLEPGPRAPGTCAHEPGSRRRGDPATLRSYAGPAGRVQDRHGGQPGLAMPLIGIMSTEAICTTSPNVGAWMTLLLPM